MVACWTPVGPDWELVENKSGPTRLGFVLMLKFFELEGRFPQFVEEFPQASSTMWPTWSRCRRRTWALGEDRAGQ
ncbi:hypothetical protein GCM10010343_23790 [Streptomyces avidinii]|nr:hypothetical protein GCM10010343_23790 [Streptomyces avidinii]